jgi:hypothetical protein
MQPDQPLNNAPTPAQQPEYAGQPPQPTPPVYGQPPVAPAYDYNRAPAAPSIAPVNYESNPFLSTLTGLVTMLKVNPIASILSGLFITILFIAVLIVGGILSAVAPIVGIPITSIAIILLIPVSIGAGIYLASSSIEGRTVKTSELFSASTKKLLPMLGATLLIGLIVFVGLILLVVPGILFAAWFSLTYFVIFHENLGVIPAMKRSRELVKGHVWEILGSSVAGMLISGGGGGLLTIPTSIAPFSGRYQELTDLKASGQPKPKTHWLNYFVPIVTFVLIVAYVVGVGIIASKSNSTINNGYTTPTYNSSNSSNLYTQ